MMEWDSRMKNTYTVQVLKAAIPFFDVSVGESIDLEGLFGAIRPFATSRESRIVDMILQFFQMRRMLDLMSMMQSMQEDTDGGMDLFSIFEAIWPGEQQDASPASQAGEDGDDHE